MTRILAASLTLSALFSCGMGREDQVLLLKADPANGAKVFLANCARCHGPDGTGTTTGPDFHTQAKADSKKVIITTVINGRPAPAATPNGNSMPAFGSTFTDQQIADVADYVKTTFGQ